MKTEEITIARDANCDLFLDSDGNIALVSGKNAYAQIVNAKMRTTVGEMMLNMDGGLPYFQTVFADSDLIPIWQAEGTDMVTSLPFVKSIIAFNCEVEGNVLKYELKIETDEGNIEVNG